ncbi:MAG TPA: hypothetical protein VFZ66_06105 [Herpetosiphonaceae bacterium]
MPSNPTVGRGALLFAALMFGLSIFLGVARRDWREAIFWLAISLFMACYGGLMLNVVPQIHRLLLIVGLLAGGVAFWMALQASFGF